MSILDRINRAVTGIHFPREERKKILERLDDINNLLISQSSSINGANIIDQLNNINDKLNHQIIAALVPGQDGTQDHNATMLSQHLVAKFVTILTHIHSNNEIVRGMDTPDYIWRQLNCFNALAQIYGQLNSMEHKASIDGNGRPIPWYTYPTIEYLNNLDFLEKRVFEWGSGNSSLWWATRCREIVAVESDRGWYDKVNSIKSHIGGSFHDYRLCEDLELYVNHHDIVNSHIVIIDGTHRIPCAGFFLSKLAEPNNFEILIYDNADWQPEVLAILNQKLRDWVQVDFHGFGPINDFTTTTTVFVNCKVKQKYGSFSSIYAAPHKGEPVSSFKNNYYVSEFLLK